MNAISFKIGNLRGTVIHLLHVAIKGKKVSVPYVGGVKRISEEVICVTTVEVNGNCEI